MSPLQCFYKLNSFLHKWRIEATQQINTIYITLLISQLIDTVNCSSLNLQLLLQPGVNSPCCLNTVLLSFVEVVCGRYRRNSCGWPLTWGIHRLKKREREWQRSQKGGNSSRGPVVHEEEEEEVASSAPPHHDATDTFCSGIQSVAANQLEKSTD